MICVSDFQIDTKYYIMVRMPYDICGRYKQLHVQVLNLRECNGCEYVTFQVTESSKDNISESGRNPITIPLGWVRDVQTLSSILNPKLINDAIYTIDQYL